MLSYITKPSTWPGARLPHAWLFDAIGGKHSTLDLAGGGAFTLFTGLGGNAWATAAASVSEALGISFHAHVIGPRQRYTDHTGDWSRTREVGDTGVIVTRPDQHVCWRHDTLTSDPQSELMRVMTAILAR